MAGCLSIFWTVASVKSLTWYSLQAVARVDAQYLLDARPPFTPAVGRLEKRHALFLAAGCGQRLRVSGVLPNFTAGKIDRRQEQSVHRYLDTLETADRTQPREIQARTERLQEKIKKLRQRMHKLDGIREG